MNVGNIIGIAFVCLIAYQCRFIVTGLLFAPYRTRFMQWFMMRYNPHYRAAKAIYDELIAEQMQCMQGAINIQDGYNRFLDQLRNDKRFRSLDAIREQWYGKDSSLTAESLLESGSIATHDLETFTCFHGTWINWHKVNVLFIINEHDGIWLKEIHFFYHEETKSYDSFYYSIEKQCFPNDPDPRGKRKRIPIPVNGPLFEKPQDVLV